MKKYIIMAVGALALVGISVGASIFIIGGQQAPIEEAAVEEEPPPPPIIRYFEFKPEFVVNINNNGHQSFLMAEVSVSTEDEEALAVLDSNNPELRNDILMLFGNQDTDVLSTTEGKTQLRAETLAAVQAVVERHYGKPAINEVFFTRFVVQ